jgi:hypothetical protein
VNAQEWPIAASRLFFVRRRVTVRDLPESRVTGAQPAKACSARSSANRSRSSPISASTIAPLMSARPGKLVMIS